MRRKPAHITGHALAKHLNVSIKQVNGWIQSRRLFSDVWRVRDERGNVMNEFHRLPNDENTYWRGEVLRQEDAEQGILSHYHQPRKEVSEVTPHVTSGKESG